VPGGEAFCAACRKIQPPPPQADHFAILGVPRRFGVDPAELEKRFRELSRQLHPDRFARADARERRFSLERTTRLNDAYRALREERTRAEYLLRLLGHDPVAESATLHDPEFLEEQMELREAIAQAKAGGDVAVCQQVAEGTRAKLARLYADVRSLFVEHEQGRPVLADIARLVARARYYQNILSDLGDGGVAAGASP
jgi:molecular chaperone HscB